MPAVLAPDATVAPPRGGPSLFAELLGDAYARLPPAVRAFHDAELPVRFQGQAHVHGARGRLARIAAWMAGLPRLDATVAVTVEVKRQGEGQHWHRDFGGVHMRSTLVRCGPLLHERLYLLRFAFRLIVQDEGIDWQVRSVRLLGLPLPLRLFREVRARESQAQGRYQFEVSAGLPLLGHIVAYKGWLQPEVAH